MENLEDLVLLVHHLRTMILTFNLLLFAGRPGLPGDNGFRGRPGMPGINGARGAEGDKGLGK